MSGPIDRDRVFAFIRKHLLVDPDVEIIHLESVSAKTFEIASRYYQGANTRPGISYSEITRQLNYAGLLHDMIDVRGSNFDAIAEVADRQVAQFVATYATDNRLPSIRSVNEHRGHIANCEIALQILALADRWVHAYEINYELQAEKTGVQCRADDELQNLALQADNWLKDLEAYRGLRFGLLGEYRVEAQTDLTAISRACIEELRARSRRVSIARNIKERKEAAARKAKEQ